MAVSLWFAGIEYVHDLLFRLHQVNEHASLINQLTGKALRGALLLVAAVALGAAFLRGIMWRTASWSFMAVSTVVWPWYLAWAFPYAALERRALVQYLVLLPLAAALLEGAFPTSVWVRRRWSRCSSPPSTRSRAVAPLPSLRPPLSRSVRQIVLPGPYTTRTAAALSAR